LELIDAGAEEIEEEDGYITITTAMEDFGRMQKKLEELQVVAENARLQRIPNDYKKLNVEDTKKVMKMIDTFEDEDDVQNVYHNLEIPDELYDEMED
jgi:transcriptional/translational regulatory protein YebC/TACO1